MAEAPRDADAAMQAYADGDEAAFAELYDAIARRLFGWLHRQTRDRQSAEDLLQQTFLHIHHARGRFIRGAEVLPWAFAIARRLLIDRLRKSGREVSIENEDGTTLDPVSSGSGPEDDAMARQLETRIHAAFSCMPESQRTAFQLVNYDDLSYLEVAAVLGTTVSAVKALVHRARQGIDRTLGRTPGQDEEGGR